LLGEARAIAAALKSKCPLCVIHKSCASAALLVAFSCDRILIAPDATMGCHPVCTSCTGNSQEMRTMATALDQATEAVLEAVQARTGKTADEIRSWFNPEKDKMFTAQEAVNVGLANGFFELPPG
jgi:ATP-dependent protease ClpP protease subunit